MGVDVRPAVRVPRARPRALPPLRHLPHPLLHQPRRQVATLQVRLWQKPANWKAKLGECSVHQGQLSQSRQPRQQHNINRKWCPLEGWVGWASLRSFVTWNLVSWWAYDYFQLLHGFQFVHIHKRNETEMECVKEFKCELCGKSFKHEMGLKRGRNLFYIWYFLCEQLIPFKVSD